MHKGIDYIFKNNDCDDCEPTQPFDAGKVYSDQLNFREILITGDITDTLIERAVIPIINFNRHDEACESKIKDYVREPIKLLINSSGGLVDACMALVSTIKASKTPIHTIVLGKAYSAGFLILIAGHERYAQRYARVMMHPGSGGYVGSIPSILKHAHSVYELQERVNDYVVENTLISKADMDEMTEHEEDWYMYAEEALCAGVVDGIIISHDKIIGLDEYQESIKEEQKVEEPVREEKPKPVKKAKIAKGE